jgi:hypothetical protein
MYRTDIYGFLLNGISCAYFKQIHGLSNERYQTMKKFLNQSLVKCGAVLATTAMLSFPVSAALITQTQIFTEDGQDFSFDFSGLDLSDGANGLLTIETRNATTSSNPDFAGLDLDSLGEFFDVGFEGVSLGSYSCNGDSSFIQIPGNTGGIDCEFTLDISLDGAQLLSSLVDGMLSFSVNFSDDVNDFGEGEEIVVSLAYTDAVDDVEAVSAPSTVALLGLTVLGFAASRRFLKN